MVRNGALKYLFSLLLTITLVSVGLLFALVERSPEAFVKMQNSFRASGEVLLTVSTTTLTPPVGNSKNNHFLTEKILQTSNKRQVLFIVAHGRSGSTFLADIFNQHPRVFYVFEPLHGLIANQGKGYDQYALNFLHRIFQCDFSAGNATRDFGRFFRFYSRALSSPPFCKYEPLSRL